MEPIRDSQRWRRRNRLIQAVREAGPQCLHFGVFTDITSTAPDNILATYLATTRKASERIVAGIKAGSPLPTTNVVFGLKDSDVMNSLTTTRRSELSPTTSQICRNDQGKDYFGRDSNFEDIIPPNIAKS